MRLVIQRVKEASVSIDGEKVSAIGKGLLVLASKVCFEKTFDDFYKDADRIYYLNEAIELNGIYRVYPQVAGGVVPKMKEYFPQIEEATRFTYMFETASLLMPESDKRVDVGLTCLSDTSFFRVFDRKCLAGKCSVLLCRPSWTQKTVNSS